MKIVMYRHSTAEVLNLAELQMKPGHLSQANDS